MLRLPIVTTSILVLALAASASAQRPGRRPSAFDQATKVGEMIPDVSGFDASGKPLNLRDLKGHYTVLVFGCLT